jgi:hypothetical protein
MLELEAGTVAEWLEPATECCASFVTTLGVSVEGTLAPMAGCSGGG